MIVRPLKPEDIPILKHYAEASGFPYPDFGDPRIESFLVVVDSQDRPIVACAAKRLIELYGYFDPMASGAVKMSAMKMLHDGMAKSLRAKLYTDIELFIPPQIAEKFGRRLERTFQCVKNWPSWVLRF